MKVSKNLYITYVTKIDALKGLISDFESPNCQRILKSIIETGVYIKYRRGSLGVENKYFKGILTQTYAQFDEDKSNDSEDKDLSEKLSMISRERGPDIQLGNLNRRTTLRQTKHRKREIKQLPPLRLSRPVEDVVFSAQINESPNLLGIPDRKSLKTRFDVALNADSQKSRVTDKSIPKKAGIRELKNTFIRFKTFKSNKSKAGVTDNHPNEEFTCDSLEKEDVVEIAIKDSKLDNNKLFKLIQTLY